VIFNLHFANATVRLNTVSLLSDDTQLYLSFDPGDAQSAIARLNSCLVDIRAWMTDNFLKLNDDKTKLLLIGIPKRVAKIQNFQVLVGDNAVKP